jgi:hypothetical protein
MLTGLGLDADPLGKRHGKTRFWFWSIRSLQVLPDACRESVGICAYLSAEHPKNHSMHLGQFGPLFIAEWTDLASSAADRFSASEAVQYLQGKAEITHQRSSGEVMPPSNNSLRTNTSTSETPGLSATPVTAKPLADHSPDDLSLEQWTQNGLRRLNDQVTPFPRVF